MQPHDALFKRIFRDPLRAFELLSIVLPDEVTKDLRPNSVKLESVQDTETDLSKRYTDLVFFAYLGEEETLFSFLIEHQSTSDRLMSFRMLEYVTRLQRAWVDRHKKPVRIPMIVPIVLYHHHSSWMAPTEVSELIELSDMHRNVLQEYMPRLRFFLYEINAKTDRELESLAVSATTRLAFLLLKHARYSRDLPEQLRNWTRLFAEVVSAPHGLGAFATLMAYIHYVNETIETEDIKRFVKGAELGQNVEETIMTLAERLKREGFENGHSKGLTEGHSKGLMEGRIAGKRQMVLRLIKTRFQEISDVLDARIQNASESELDRWVERVLVAVSPEDIFISDSNS